MAQFCKQTQEMWAWYQFAISMYVFCVLLRDVRRKEMSSYCLEFTKLATKI